VQRQYEISGFTGIVVSGSIRIKVIKDEKWDVRVFSSREESNSIKVRFRNDIFQISISEREYPHSPPPVVVVTMPELTLIDLDGPVEMEARGFTTASELCVSMGPSSFLNLNGFEASQAVFELEGPCTLHAFLSVEDMKILSSGVVTIRLGGRAQNFKFLSDQTSRLDGSMLLVDNAELDLQGKSEIRLTPDLSLSVKSRDEALIYYNGEYFKDEPVVEGPAILRKY